MSTAVWHNRDEWLELLEELQDPATIERLESVGVGAGWHTLEVGAGRGSIAGWLTERVGPPGRVVATDVDTSLLEGRDEPGVEVLHHDVLTDDFPAASFDLIHCRALLVHLSEPERALERMAGWLRPGGVLVAEEPWIDLALLALNPIAARAVEALRQEMDTGFARRLPATLREVGLEGVRAEGQLRFFDGGSAEAAFHQRVLGGACAKLVASGSLAAVEARRFLQRFDDPDFCDCGSASIGAVGWKPGGSGEQP